MAYYTVVLLLNKLIAHDTNNFATVAITIRRLDKNEWSLTGSLTKPFLNWPESMVTAEENWFQAAWNFPSTCKES